MKPEENGLGRIRDEIDHIDAEILRLFKQRMDCARQVAQIKSGTGQPVFHPEREREILERVGIQGGAYGSQARVLFANLMDLSRALQRELLAGDSALRQSLLGAPETLEIKPGQTVACQGVAGSFSEEGSRMRFGDMPRRFYPRFSDVFAALARDDCPVGVLPAENSSAGTVDEVYDLLQKHRFYIIGTVDVPVRHCLCGVKGSRLDGIRTVYSHPQALAQCSEWLETHEKRAEPFSNTAAAAKMISQRGEATHAVICSRRAAAQYNLEILASGIQNERSNRTRFIVVSKQLVIPKHANRISICFALPHVTGSLYHVLQRFALHGYNLTRIQSAPIPEQPFEYRFFVDFMSNAREEGAINLLCSLDEELPSFTFLGSSVAPEWKEDSELDHEQ